MQDLISTLLTSLLPNFNQKGAESLLALIKSAPYKENQDRLLELAYGLFTSLAEQTFCKEVAAAVVGLLQAAQQNESKPGGSCFFCLQYAVKVAELEGKGDTPFCEALRHFRAMH